MKPGLLFSFVAPRPGWRFLLPAMVHIRHGLYLFASVIVWIVVAVGAYTLARGLNGLLNFYLVQQLTVGVKAFYEGMQSNPLPFIIFGPLDYYAASKDILFMVSFFPPCLVAGLLAVNFLLRLPNDRFNFYAQLDEANRLRAALGRQSADLDDFR